jgi:hypothetical protein
MASSKRPYTRRRPVVFGENSPQGAPDTGNLGDPYQSGPAIRSEHFAVEPSNRELVFDQAAVQGF